MKPIESLVLAPGVLSIFSSSSYLKFETLSLSLSSGVVNVVGFMSRYSWFKLCELNPLSIPSSYLSLVLSWLLLGRVVLLIAIYLIDWRCHCLKVLVTMSLSIHPNLFNDEYT